MVIRKYCFVLRLQVAILQPALKHVLNTANIIFNTNLLLVNNISISLILDHKLRQNDVNINISLYVECKNNKRMCRVSQKARYVFVIGDK